jgi:phosphate transport system protein
VDKDYENLLAQLMDPTQFPGESIESLLLLVLVLRCIERMADHAVNVSRRVARLGDA